MGFLGKDWNVIAVTFERADLFRVNGNRGKGSDAVKMRDNARRHARSLYWAVFDQRGRFLEGDTGPGRTLVPAAKLESLVQIVRTNESVLSVLATLQSGESQKAAKMLAWPDEAQEPAKKSSRTYKLVVSAGEGEEFESSLKLNQAGQQVSGVLLAPDGSEVEIERASLDGTHLTFEVDFGSPNEPMMLKFEGKVLPGAVKGTLAPAT